MAGTVWVEGAPQGTVSGYALFGMPIPLDNAVVWADASATFTECSATGAGWTSGAQTPGGSHIVLLAVPVQQPSFAATAASWTESTATAPVWVESGT